MSIGTDKNNHTSENKILQIQTHSLSLTIKNSDKELSREECGLNNGSEDNQFFAKQWVTGHQGKTIGFL
jgi:hypothetical protein